MAGAPARTLTEADYARAAAALGVDVPAIKAIAEVESKGDGFLATNEPKILFERHHFSRLTGGKYDRTHPDISHPKWIPGSYGPESIQHARLQKAVALDRNAALQSCSWGAFQIMGFNWQKAGFKSLQDFINAMYRGIDGHLDALIGLIKGDQGMRAALKAHNWPDFASRYNGPGYAQNKYHIKLNEAWHRHAKGKA